jgi:hypothetical protein
MFWVTSFKIQPDISTSAIRTILYSVSQTTIAPIKSVENSLAKTAPGFWGGPKSVPIVRARSELSAKPMRGNRRRDWTSPRKELRRAQMTTRAMAPLEGARSVVSGLLQSEKTCHLRLSA